MTIQRVLKKSKMHELSMQQMLTSRNIGDLYHSALRNYDMTPIQWLVLGVAADETVNGGIRVTDLATLFDVKTTYITSTLNSLRVKGYIDTKYDSNDARVRLVIATPVGARQVSAIEKHMQTEVAQLLDGVVTPQDLDVYLRSVKKLAAYRPA